MQALLLAGGLGTRLRSVVNDRPKPMALINGKPFLEYLLVDLKMNGIKDIIFAVGYKANIVEEYFGDGAKIGMNISYSYEESQLGTAGAIKNASESITGDTFYVLNADTYYKMDYGYLYETHIRLKADMTVVLRNVPDISRYGQARAEGNRLRAFNEKVMQQISGTINGGVYLMNTSVLSQIPEGKVSLENDVIPKLIEKNAIIGAVEEKGYFIDIGVPDDYYKFENDVKEGIVKW